MDDIEQATAAPGEKRQGRGVEVELIECPECGAMVLSLPYHDAWHQAND